MGIFKALYKAKKEEIEMKQGQQGRKAQMLIILAGLGFYWLKAILMFKTHGILLILLVPITIFIVIIFLKSNNK